MQSIVFREWYLRTPERNEFGHEAECKFQRHCKNLKCLHDRLVELEWPSRKIREEIYAHCWYK